MAALKIVPTHRQRLQEEIALLEDRQERRRLHVIEVQALIAQRQMTVDNLRAQLEHCDE